MVQRAAIAGPAAGLAPAFARAPEFVPRSAGRPLGATVRRDFEPRFGLDFGAVRIHTDAAATAAATGLSARAFTLGPDIFFGRGEYAPATSGGRRLLAHELAHVVQQGQGLAPPMVQRAPVAGDAGQRQADALSAQMISILQGRSFLALGDVRDLLIQSQKLALQFQDETQPHTRIEAARALLTIFDILKEREQSAPRGPAGELLRTSDFGQPLGPWTESRPKRVEEIPLFSPRSIQALSLVVLPEPPAATPAGGGHRARRRPPSSEGTVPPGQQPETPLKVDEPSILVGSTLEEADLEARTPGGGAEIRKGIQNLRSVTIGQAVQALAAPRDEPGLAKAKAVLPKNAGSSLFNSTGLVLFIANRIYVLDRDGHIIPGDLKNFTFDLGGVTPSLGRGGTFFLARLVLGARNQADALAARALFQVGAGAAQLISGEVFPKFANEGFIPLDELITETIARNLGVAVIVSSRFQVREGEDPTAADFKRIARAVNGAKKYLFFEVGRAILDMVDNPADTLAGMAFDEGVGAIASRVPAISALGLGVSVLKGAEWLGTVGNIAARARSEDEVDIASQAIARKLAEFVIGGLISRGIAKAKDRIGQIKGRARAAGGGQPSPGGQQPPEPGEPLGPPLTPEKTAAPPKAPPAEAGPSTRRTPEGEVAKQEEGAGAAGPPKRSKEERLAEMKRQAAERAAAREEELSEVRKRQSERDRAEEPRRQAEAEARKKAAAPTPAPAAAPPVTIRANPIHDSLTAAQRPHVAAVEATLMRIAAQAVQDVDAGVVSGPHSARLASVPVGSQTHAAARGNAIHERAFALIQNAVSSGALPSATVTDKGVAHPKLGLTHAFSGKRPDIRVGLGGGEEAVFDVTTRGQAGHVRTKYTRPWVRYVIEFLY